MLYIDWGDMLRERRFPAEHRDLVAPLAKQHTELAKFMQQITIRNGYPRSAQCSTASRQTSAQVPQMKIVEAAIRLGDRGSRLAAATALPGRTSSRDQLGEQRERPGETDRESSGHPAWRSCRSRAA